MCMPYKFKNMYFHITVKFLNLPGGNFDLQQLGAEFTQLMFGTNININDAIYGD